MAGADRSSGAGRASGLVLLSAISVQTGSALAVHIFERTSPLGAVFLRTLAAALLLLAILLVRGRRFRAGDLRLAAPFALTVALTNASFYQAIARLPLGDTVALEFVGPIVVATIASRRRRDLIWIALAVIGVFAITRRLGGPLNPVGVGFALLAGAGWGTYTVVGKRMASSGRREPVLALGLAISACVLALPALIQTGATLTDPAVIGQGIALGVLASAIPYTVELMAVERISLTTFGVLLSLQPFMAAAAGLIYLRQGISPPEIAGFLCISGASAGIAATGQQQDPAVAVATTVAEP